MSDCVEKQEGRRVTVIMPSYNAAPYIETAVRSALCPTLSQEILVISDGSTDGTDAVVSALAEKYPAVRLIRQENGGPAAARNRGIEEARGEYLLFLDSDDAFCPDVLPLALAEAEGKELTVFSYELVQDGVSHRYGTDSAPLSSAEDWQKSLGELYRKNLINQVWAKIFSTRLLKEENLRFPHRMWGEDRLFLFAVMEKASRVFVSALPLCRYVQRKGSLVSRHLAEKAAICLEIDTAVRALAEKKGAQTKENDAVFWYMYAKSLISSFVTMFSGTVRGRRTLVKEALRQKAIPELSSFPCDCGSSFRLLVLLLRSGSPWLILWASYGIYLSSRFLPSLFRRAKHGYNKE